MNYFEEITEYFNNEIKFVLNSIDEIIISKITEIRIRKDRPIIIVIKNVSYFLDYNGDLYDYPTHNAVQIDGDSFDKLFLKLCNYSVYSAMESMKKGFITLSSGARIGIGSTCVTENDNIKTIKDVTSFNIRIPRQVVGSANNLLNFLYVNSFPSIIIAGKPNSGKTTLLRDLAYQLSNGFNNRYSKVVIIDERNEIAGKVNSNYVCDIGLNTDVLTGFNKATGIEIATRTLSPELIACDEISTLEELESIKFAFASGISFALTIHASSKEDLLNKDIAKRLIETGEFKYIVMLESYTYQTSIIEISEVQNEVNRNDFDSSFNNSSWSSNFDKSKKEI